MMLTPGQVSSLLGCSSYLLHRMVEAGQIKSTRTIGGHLRFLQSDVDAYIRKIKEENK